MKSKMVFLITLIAMFIAGCAPKTVTLPNGTVMSESTYMAQKSMENKDDAREESLRRVMGGVQHCAQGDTDCQHTNQLWLVQVPWVMQSLDGGGVDPGYWQLMNAREERRDPLRYLSAFNQTMQTLCYTGAAPWSCFGGGSSSGSSVKITAKDGSRIENIDMTQGNQSPFITGSDNLTGTGKSGIAADEGMAATNKGQNQTGSGSNQASNQTDPPLINQPEAPFTNESGTGIQLP